MTGKICPVGTMGKRSMQLVIDGDATEYFDAVPCRGPACAWWDASAGHCAVLSIARKK